MEGLLECSLLLLMLLMLMSHFVSIDVVVPNSCC
jgi:hypothetical protein